MGATPNIPVDPTEDAIKVYDVKYDEYRNKRKLVSNIVMLAVQSLLAYYYYQSYKEQLEKYKEIIERMTDIVEIKHRWYVDVYDANRDQVYSFLNSFPEFPINYDNVVNAMEFAANGLYSFSTCGKNLQNSINDRGFSVGYSRRVNSARVSAEAHMYQRRLRDVEALEYAYDVQRMNNKNKANRYSNQEFSNSMQYFQNAANYRQSLMQMAASNYSGNMTGALYHLDHLTNGRTQAKTSYENPSDATHPSPYDGATPSKSDSYNSGSYREGGRNG